MGQRDEAIAVCPNESSGRTFNGLLQEHDPAPCFRRHTSTDTFANLLARCCILLKQLPCLIMHGYHHIAEEENEEEGIAVLVESHSLITVREHTPKETNKVHVDATGNGQVDAPANAVPKRKLLYYLVAHVDATVEWQSQLPVYIEAVPALLLVRSGPRLEEDTAALLGAVCLPFPAPFRSHKITRLHSGGTPRTA